MEIIYRAFGFLMEICYKLVGSFGGYAAALLLFSLIVQLILFPFSIKQQKNSQKQAKLRPKESAIRKKYAGRNDRETQMKMNEEIQRLYQEEHFSPLSGCLPLLIQFPILIGLFYVIQRPLSYISGLDVAAIESIRDAVVNFLPEKFAAMDVAKNLSQLEIPLIQAINEMGGKEALLELIPSLSDVVIPNFTILKGFLDLSKTPWDAFDGEWQLIIIPVLTFLSAYFGQKLTI